VVEWDDSRTMSGKFDDKEDGGFDDEEEDLMRILTTAG
jgi:hypothetical protein